MRKLANCIATWGGWALLGAALSILAIGCRGADESTPLDPSKETVLRLNQAGSSYELVADGVAPIEIAADDVTVDGRGFRSGPVTVAGARSARLRNMRGSLLRVDDASDVAIHDSVWKGLESRNAVNLTVENNRFELSEAASAGSTLAATVDGQTMAYGIYYTDPNGLIFRNNTVTAGGSGYSTDMASPNKVMSLSRPVNCLFENNVFRAENVWSSDSTPWLIGVFGGSANRFVRNEMFLKIDTSRESLSDSIIGYRGVVMAVRDDTERNVIENNTLRSNACRGIAFWTDATYGTTPRDNIVRNNRIYESCKAIWIDDVVAGSTENVIEGNLLYSDNGPTLNIDGLVGATGAPAKLAKFVNNTILSKNGAAIYGEGANGSGESRGDVYYRNNVIYGGGGSALPALFDNDAANNFNGNPGFASGLFLDPFATDPSGTAFRLEAASLVNRGVKPTDSIGGSMFCASADLVSGYPAYCRTYSGSVPDIGAYEAGSPAPLPGDSASSDPPPADAPPTVSLTSPSSGARVRGTIAISANASDNNSVANVQFKVDGANLGAADASSPYSTSLDTTALANGSHTISAVATDNAGLTATASLSVTVDNAAPTVSITAPANGATVAATITLSASASDNAGVAGVQFKVDGANRGAEDTSSPYSITLNTTALSNGRHTISAVARDAAGNTATAQRSVTVSNEAPPPPPNNAPQITSFQAVTGSKGAATFSVAAADPDSDPLTCRIDFGDGVSAACGSSVPHTYPAGIFSACAEATDPDGASDRKCLEVLVNNGIRIKIRTASPLGGGRTAATYGLEVYHLGNFGSLTPADATLSLGTRAAFAAREATFDLATGETLTAIVENDDGALRFAVRAVADGTLTLVSASDPDAVELLTDDPLGRSDADVSSFLGGGCGAVSTRGASLLYLAMLFAITLLKRGSPSSSRRRPQ